MSSPASRSQAFRELLLRIGASFSAFVLIIFGALSGTNIFSKFLLAAICGFVGGLAVARVRVSSRSATEDKGARYATAGGWAAYAVVAGAVGYAVFRSVEAPEAFQTFVLVGLVGGVAGGVAAAIVEWLLFRHDAIAHVRTALGLALSSVVFLMLFRSSQVLLGLVSAAVLYSVVVGRWRTPTARP